MSVLEDSIREVYKHNPVRMREVLEALPEERLMESLDSNRVGDQFVWADTKQGQEFWSDVEAELVLGVVRECNEDSTTLEEELEYLRFFHAEVDFGPTHEDVADRIDRAFTSETGKDVPEGYK